MKQTKSFYISILIIFAVTVTQFAHPEPAFAARLCGGTASSVYYVDASAPAGTNDGCSWATAYLSLQDALAGGTLASGDEIRVADGTYYPDEGAGQTNNDRLSTFTLIDGISVYGGYTGYGAPNPELRDLDPATNNTILSGDIDGTPADDANNAYHVVSALNITSVTELSGFTIRDGNPQGSDGFGGGMYISNSSSNLQVMDVLFTNNTAFSGGGMATFVSNPTLMRVIFVDNTILNYGGGFYNQDGSPSLIDVTFDNNHTTLPAAPGAGMHSTNSDPGTYTVAPTLTNVTFSNNVSEAGGGGGMFNNVSDAIYTNVTFTGNSAFVRGGALLNEGSAPVFNNVTFRGNTAANPAQGNAMINILSGAIPSNPVINNTILWETGDADIVNEGGSTVTINDSIMHDGSCPTGGTCTNVQFNADPVLGALADNGGFTRTIAIGLGSSALDMGNNGTCAATDQRGVSRPQPTGGNCDIGAFELDNTAPTVTINQAGAQADPTNVSPINFTVVFSESVTGFTAADVSLSSGTAVVTGSGTTYNVAVSGMAQGVLTATIPAGGATDAAGNGNSASTSTDNTVTYDSTGPTVTINQALAQADPTNVSPINFTVVFSESVTGFTAADVSLSSGTAVVTGSGTTYNVAVSAMAQGVLTATVNAGAVTDALGNGSSASTSTDNTVTYDSTGPTVTINQALAQADPTNASPINFTVVFSESVTGFTAADVSLSSGTAVVTGSGTTYNVAVSAMAQGVLTATVNAGAVTDALGNSSSASTSTDNTVTYNVAPLITSANTTTFAIGAAGTFTVTATGYPIPTIAHTAGALPSGVTFTDNGNGTATLAGTPSPGTANAYTLTFIASNGVNPDDSQIFTLTVTEAPAFTSADNTAFVVGSAGSFTVTTSGTPTVTTITHTAGALPANVTFTDNGNGTAALSGTPQVGTDGTYNLVFIASNGVGADARQDFSLTVNLAPPPIIAVDGIGSVPDSGGGFIAEAEIVSVSIISLSVTFDQDVQDAGVGDPDSVTNPANYILVQDNGDGIQTTTCAPGGGVIGGDIAITIDSVTYGNGGGSGPFVATLNLNGGTALVEGAYRLIVCGTTSIVNQFGVALAGDGVNPDTDFMRNFVIAFGTIGSGGSADAKTLPATGFPMGVLTDLPSQPASQAYAAYGDLWLEVPKLGLKMSIVGVPQTEDTWDVTWLGKDAGYLQGTAFPTWAGNTVLTAHVWDAFNKPGPFSKIKNLLYGDQVKIHAFGQVYTYEVRESRLVSQSNIHSALKHENLDWVTLLTCEDYKVSTKNYSYRRAVRAVLISAMAEK